MSSMTRVSTSRLMAKRSEVTMKPARSQAFFSASTSFGNSSSSSCLPTSWRQTWSDAGAFPSPTLRRTEEVRDGPQRDLSTPARRANHNAERTMQQFSTAQQLTISRSKWKGKEQDARNLPNTNATVLASRQEREDAFKEDVAAVDTLIHNLAANLRLDGGINSKEARELERLKKEREEARLRQVAEERAARQKEAEARDPHKKVHLKLENTRKFGKDFLEELRVPMQQVDFVTEAGVDHVNMVDILQIRQRCKRCDTRATPSVDTLIQDQTRSDALRGLDPKTGKPLALPAGSSHSAKGEAATTKKSQSGSSSKL